MKPLICTAFALSLLATPVLVQAQPAGVNIENKGGASAPSVAVGPPRTQTTGGDTKDPEPHIYKLGEHLSMSYGAFELVDDWAKYQLKEPPSGQHWVRYGNNFMRVNNTDALINEIVKAS